MNISLIVTTYNWKDALELILLSAFNQTIPPLEIIVADDGSREDTREMIDRLRPNSPVPLQHVWHEDQGFRAAKIRNRAIAAAGGDYLVMIDGDMVLHPKFIADHRAAARIGCFVQGGRLQTGAWQASQLLDAARFTLSPFSRDVRNRKNAVNSKILSRCCSYESKRLEGIRTCNLAAWRDDILNINGFDEKYVGWGREDSDFALRLMNSGVRRFNLKFLATAIHLYHPENSRDCLAENDLLLRQAQEDGVVRCELGIDQYLS